MAESEFVGVIRNAQTGEIYAVVNPDEDSELDNTRWLLLKRIGDTAPVEMIKVTRSDYMTAMSNEELSELCDRISQS
jgi:hypothetical protein